MATKSTTLIGRFVKIDFHTWDFATVPGNTPAEKVAFITKDSNALYRTMGQHYGEEAEIVSSDSDKGLTLLFADGTVGPGAELFFRVLPKKPEALPAWEYLRAVSLNTAQAGKLGAEGWELVSVLWAKNKDHWIFKRRKN